MAKYTFNFTDKSVLTSLSLFCKSGLLFTVLLLFSSSVCSADMLCINLFSYSTLHFLFLSFCYTPALSVILFLCSISFCACSPLFFQQVCSTSTHSLILLFFNSLLLCSAFYLTLHICSISSCASSSYLFLQFHSFSLTE